MPKLIELNDDFLEEMVQQQLVEAMINEGKDGWWSSLWNATKRVANSFKRWTNKQLYDNNREQAVANIETDEDNLNLLRIKEFFSLFSEVCYEGSKYSQAFNQSWAIEDPGTYCIQPDTVEKLNSWYRTNKIKFLKELKSATGSNEAVPTDKTSQIALKIVEDYVDDFCSTFDYYGLRIEFGAERLTVAPESGMELMKACLKVNPRLGLYNNSSQPCLVDCFPFLFKFVWNLNSPNGFQELSNTNAPSPRLVFRSARLAAANKSFLPSLKSQKNSVFVNKLRKDAQLRKQWTGFCYNMTFDPYGEHSLDFWTNDVDALKTKDQSTDIDFYSNMIVGTAGYLVVDKAATMAAKTAVNALRAAQAAKAAALAAAGGSTVAAGTAAAPASWGVSLVASLVVAGVFTLLSFDPFEWFSIRDDVEEELEKMTLILKDLLEEVKNVDAANSNLMSLEIDQKKLDSMREDYVNCSNTITKLIHGSMLEGLQRNIESFKQDMDSKKTLLGNLSRTIEMLNSLSKSLTFKQEHLNSTQVQKSITFLETMLKQVKSTSSEQAEWDHKMKRDISVGQDLQSIEKIKVGGSPGGRASLINENSEDKEKPKESAESKTFSDPLMKKLGKVLEEKYKVSFMDVDNQEEINKSLRLARNLDAFYSKKTNKGIKSKFPSAVKFLDGSDPGNLNGQVSSFADWWKINSSGKGEIISDPKIPSSRTFLHKVWVQAALGLKSTSEYKRNELVNPRMQNQIGAFCGIGLGHALANTSFYYCHKVGSEIFNPNGGSSGSVASVFYDKSETMVKGNSVSLINKGIKIQRLKSILNPNLSNSDLKNEFEKAINIAVSKIDSKTGTLAESDPLEATKVRIFNILAKIYRDFEFGTHKFAMQLAAADEKISVSMEKNANLLASLQPTQQNTEQHGALLSKLRQGGAWKIMIFQALMNL